MGDVKSVIVDTVCPHCHKTEKSKIWISVNNLENPRITKRIIDDTFFDKICSNCGKLYYLDYTVTYRDEDNNKAICYSSTEEEFMQLYYTFTETNRTEINENLRLVRNRNSFREKVRIFSMEMDDRVVEIMKVWSVESLRDCGYKGELDQILCWVTDDLELSFSFFDKLGNAYVSHVLMPFDSYVKIEEGLSELLSKEESKNCVIDLDWAMNFVIKHDL